MASVRYFIPEDGDSELQPNVFLAPKPRHQGAPPTLGQVKQAFPIPGRYHFRFKSPVAPGGDREKNGLAVWMDCIDDRQPVPTWQSTIVAKVTRIGIDEDEDFEDDEDFVRGAASVNSTPQPVAAPAPHAQSAPPQQPPVAQQPSLDIFGGPAPAPTNGVHQRSAAPPVTHSSPPGVNGGDLLGDFGGGAAPSVGAGANDFLGMTTPSPAASAGSYPPQQRQAPPPQQPAQAPLRHANSGNGFDKFSQNNGPFGDLGQW
uniref:DIX domain-containing protein n=1 Tax=Entomoneis paludosa TaxID=265537 RepID=A0A7S3DMQ7_9STRA